MCAKEGVKLFGDLAEATEFLQDHALCPLVFLYSLGIVSDHTLVLVWTGLVEVDF